MFWSCRRRHQDGSKTVLDTETLLEYFETHYQDLRLLQKPTRHHAYTVR